MAIIKQYHKDTDTTYVYESISYWDADKRQSRSKRKLLGKLDPETGETIPTGKRGRKKKTPADNQLSSSPKVIEDTSRIKELSLALSEKETCIANLKKENSELKSSVLALAKQLDKCRNLCDSITENRR